MHERMSLAHHDSTLSQVDISGLVGSTVKLPCHVDTKTCGNLHSIKWYRGSSRIFVFSDLAKFSKSEGDYESRQKAGLLNKEKYYFDSSPYSNKQQRNMEKDV
ncbi:hypothetical protein PGB90_007723 [Kerria lacca]